jgi:flavin-dependent dehydrogenase
MFESPSGAVVEFESPDPLYAMIRRLEFDNALLDTCKQGGIEVKEEVTISKVAVNEDSVCITSTSGEQYQADIVIGADGVNSVVAVHSGLRGPWKPTQIAIDGTEESLLSDLSVRQDTMYVNFGIGYLLYYFQKYISLNPYEQHLHFLNHLKQANVISGNSQRQNFHAYVLPIGGVLEKISSNRILLAGDAAGFVNGFTAEGIYYAMLSGEHAGKMAIEAVNKKNTSANFLRQYDKACEVEVGYEMRKSVELQKRLLSNPKLIDSIVRLANSSKAVRTMLANYAVGALSYKDMKKRAIIVALPGYLRYKAERLWLKLN